MTFALILNFWEAANSNQSLTTVLIGLGGIGFWFVLIFIFFVRRANSKAAKLWPTLAPAINGVVHKGILTYQYLKGTYHGLPVRARVRAHAKSRVSSDYYFQILATLGTRGRDWELYYDKSLLGRQGWELNTRDAALRQRLAQSGLMEMAKAWAQDASVKYDGGKGRLLYSERIPSRYQLPSPDYFKRQLDLLKRLVNINKRVNSETSASDALNR